MPDTIEKLRPDRDLQCFYFQPTAIAALSSTSESGFTVSGSWRSQFDWAVIEWNRDNVYEHPAFRNLPDGDLSGLVLIYEETRDNCIPLDSTLFATVDWPSLRIWAPNGGTEAVFYVRLTDHAEPIEGSYQSAYADFTLTGSGTPASGTYAGLAYLDTHYTYAFDGSHSLADALVAIRDAINVRPNPFQPTLLRATVTGSTIRVYYTGGPAVADSTTGVNGNFFGMYSYSTTTAGSWDVGEQTFSNGTSPTKWRITLDFSTLQGHLLNDFSDALISIPTNSIRKMRWTYAANLQTGAYSRSEFQAVVSNWTVTGTNRTYSVAGPGSRRIDNHSAEAVFNTGGSWVEERGNYFSGSIHHSTTAGDSVTVGYLAGESHSLYVGTRYTNTGATIAFTVDGSSAGSLNTQILQEDVLLRWFVGTYSAGAHSITVASTTAGDFFFDFVELALPTTSLPSFPPNPPLTVATDWDTLHSVALAPERTAWFIQSLGFTGRQNHYVGALLFYELAPVGFTYASIQVTFSGTVDVTSGNTFEIKIGRDDTTETTNLTKLMHFGDTPETLAITYAQAINNGSTGVFAFASAGVLTITARTIGSPGSAYTLQYISTNNPDLSVSVSTTPTADVYPFSTATTGAYRTDLAASPRLNRAMRDWTLSFCTALKGYGIDMAASLSMELGKGDDSVAAGIAQRGPSGDAILLPTPSLQTNFSPTSLAFWQEVYLELAAIQSTAGLTPYLQFGEVQWWYFPNDGTTGGAVYSGMPFYDAVNLSDFAAAYGHPMATITDNTVNPADYPDETAYLPTVIGNFTSAVMSYVRATYSSCRFEVLYPTDVNQTAFSQAINYPSAAWTPSLLTALKTEAFRFTFGKNLDDSLATINFGTSLGFPASQRAHLVGIGDAYAAWYKETLAAAGKRFESVVLFALDQFCLIGYDVPLPETPRRSVRVKG